MLPLRILMVTFGVLMMKLIKRRKTREKEENTRSD